MDKLIDRNTVSAECQVDINDKIFTLGDRGTADFTVLILGNSMTLHGVKEDIGWFRRCGMAASDRSRDYVHLLFARLNERVKTFFVVAQYADWETSYDRFDLSKTDETAAFGCPDLIIFRLGENVRRRDIDALSGAIKSLLEKLSGKSTKIIATTCFWKEDSIDAAIKNAAVSLGADVVELGDLGEDPKMRADGLFEHKGVALHPGDKGMESIADRIYGVAVKYALEKAADKRA